LCSQPPQQQPRQQQEQQSQLQQALPPINASSPLIALQPPQPSGAADATLMGGAPLGGITFDTSDLQSALMRSRQQVNSAGGLRRATSAPHSMDMLGQQASSTFIPPSGGPMRRVASSLGMRRSSSFFWTPTAHLSFEKAVAALTARGGDLTASAIFEEMGHVAHGLDLKVGDVDKHLKKKMLLQRRVMQQFEGASGAPEGGSSFRPRSEVGMRGGLMAAVAEEEPGALASLALPGGAPMPQTAALSEAGLAQQIQAQSMQHVQLASAREALVNTTEAQILAQQQTEALS
jgi:hypothetical protein